MSEERWNQAQTELFDVTLKDVTARLRVTFADLADALGIDDKTLYRWRKNPDDDISISIWRALCKIDPKGSVREIDLFLRFRRDVR